jgi:hypothetical protein
MSSIKRDVKKKLLPRPEGEKIGVSRSSPLPVMVLVTPHLKTAQDLFGGPQGSPRTDAMAAAVQWAERIMRKMEPPLHWSSPDRAIGSRMTGIRSWTVEVTAFGVVVRIEHDLIHYPLDHLGEERCPRNLHLRADCKLL